MKTKCLIFSTVLASSLWSQRVTDRRTAEIRGGDGDGKCTIEVVVDDVAEIEIFGRNANIRTISGSPASFRRFQCNQEMPNQPGDFRFKGIDGRGRQDLVRSPGGGPAVIRIQDSKGGSEGYTFDIFWRGGSNNYNSGGYNNDRYNNGGYNNDRYGNNGRNNNNGRYGNNRYDNNGGYNNGGNNNGRYGNNSGYNNNGNVDFQGGRNGSGSYEDRNGNRLRLDGARVVINNSGDVNVSFDSERGRIGFNGRVDRRDGNRVYARVNGSGMNGLMEIDLHNNGNVRSINMSSVRLNWSN